MSATLNSILATSARAFIPAWGCWWVEIDLDGEHTLSGAVTVVIADLTLQGTILSGGPENGRSHFRVVGGKGGWGRPIPAKAYANDAGVKASTVLLDAADACGETILASTLPTTRPGPSWVRPEGRARNVLELLAPKGWYVGEDGITRIGARTPGTLPANVTHGPVDLARGCVELASESIATILPGIVVDGLTAVDVLHEVSSEGLRSTVQGARGGSSRLLEAYGAILEQLDPDRRFRGQSEYRVTSRSGDRVGLEPVRVSTGMPELTRVVARPGLPGCKGGAAIGSRVLVAFADSSPARPYVCAYEDADGSGFVPTTLVLDASSSIKIGDGATKGVVRDGDDVCLGYFVKDATTNTIYRSPPELGPLLTVYLPWWKVTAVADVQWCTATNPATPTVPPPPGTPGTALMGIAIEASSLVKCE
ncbi:MAG TPA: hypothetical protein PK141_00550 [Polyangiaceae bacterium]|nr:hypothetical protein [Polyangiaceae bacterium]HQY59858.1 hypothetical protein [Polyangiaceae bacterium]